MALTRVEVVSTLSDVPAEQWNALAAGNPFLQHSFLEALHSTGCASRKTGWIPQYLILWKDGKVIAGMPMYLKTHSRGEYVFDHSWASAYERYGLDYYPKLVCAVPFTAVTGPRLLAKSYEEKILLAQYAVELAKQLEVSSLHVLFPEPSDITALKDIKFMLRESVQFHWKNAAYGDFEEFLASMNREKRKKIKQDRRHVVDAGVTFHRLRGTEITAQNLEFFYLCYTTTYHNHYSSPYLNLSFFKKVHQTMPNNMLLVIAEKGGKQVASALNFIGDDVMYGRYWGTTEFVSGLHFETCYMQSIQYCIENQISAFEGGAQGEHKLARGLLPTATWSAHWVADRRFAGAIEEFLLQETNGMNQYIDELETHTPFKNISERDDV